METLKPFAELCLPDERQRFFALGNHATNELRPLQHEDIYSRATEINLHSGVPEHVRDHFATAVNLLAYSWFYYPFNVTAQFMAFVSVEFALKTRYPSSKPASFKNLVERAVREGLVTDSGFSRILSPGSSASPPHLLPPMFTSEISSYSEALVGLMPSLRNSLAHGVTMLHMHGPSSVRICAEFINQLFPPLKDGG